MFKRALIICVLRLSKHYARSRIRTREYYRKNTEKVRLANEAWAARNREKAKAIKENWRIRNLEKARASARESGRRRKEQRAKYEANRYKTNPTVRLASCMRARLRNALKRIPKSATTFKLVGCTALELRSYLEKQFLPGMSWENYGRIWQVDHKKPIAVFDLSSREQQKECFHFSNLQPLWASENASKGGRYFFGE